MGQCWPGQSEIVGIARTALYSVSCTWYLLSFSFHFSIDRRHESGRPICMYSSAAFRCLGHVGNRNPTCISKKVRVLTRICMLSRNATSNIPLDHIIFWAQCRLKSCNQCLRTGITWKRRCDPRTMLWTTTCIVGFNQKLPELPNYRNHF